MIIRQSTARTIIVGPVLDSTGAAKTDEVVASIKVTKNGTVGAADGAATLTHDHAGKYKLALAAGDTDTLGVLEISLNSGTNDMPVKAANVVPANVYDSLIVGSDALDVSVIQWLGVAPLALSAQQIRAIVPDTQKVDVETIKTKAVTVDAGGTTFPAAVGDTVGKTGYSLADNAITAAKIATDALAAAKIAAAACNKIADHILRRLQANAEGSSDGDTLGLGSLYGLIQQAQESSVSGLTMTVKKTDGTTTLGTKTITTDASADPITGVL